MNLILLSVSLVIALALITLILMQAKGSGLSAVFGGSGGGVYRSKRGVEKLLHRSTVVIAALFMLVALVNILINK